MNKKTKDKLECVIAMSPMEDDVSTDCLAVALCSYFDDHMDKPENDPVDDEKGWGEWVCGKYEKAQENILNEVAEFVDTTIADLHTQLEQAKAERDDVHKEYQDACLKLNDALERIAKMQEFVRTVIRQECWALDPLDGGDLQDLAEKLGFIEKHAATIDDIDDESDFEVGDIIYKFTAALAGSQPERKENE